MRDYPNLDPVHGPVFLRLECQQTKSLYSFGNSISRGLVTQVKIQLPQSQQQKGQHRDDRRGKRAEQQTDRMDRLIMEVSLQDREASWIRRVGHDRQTAAG